MGEIENIIPDYTHQSQTVVVAGRRPLVASQPPPPHVARLADNGLSASSTSTATSSPDGGKQALGATASRDQLSSRMDTFPIDAPPTSAGFGGRFQSLTATNAASALTNNGIGSRSGQHKSAKLVPEQPTGSARHHSAPTGSMYQQRNSLRPTTGGSYKRLYSAQAITNSLPASTGGSMQTSAYQYPIGTNSGNNLLTSSSSLSPSSSVAAPTITTSTTTSTTSSSSLVARHHQNHKRQQPPVDHPQQRPVVQWPAAESHQHEMYSRNTSPNYVVNQNQNQKHRSFNQHNGPYRLAELSSNGRTTYADSQDLFYSSLASPQTSASMLQAARSTR